jgi:hypothetical protein
VVCDDSTTNLRHVRMVFNFQRTFFVKMCTVVNRKLKKTLGEFDAVVECNEIAIKEFIEKAQKENLQKYIQQLSTKHKVKVDQVDFLKFSSRIRQYYVSSVFQQAEQFLKDFKNEWQQYFSDKKWIELANGETKLQNTLRNISLDLPNDLNDVYEYYRLIRNYMSHTDRDLKELQNLHNKIETNQNEFLSELNLSAKPNIVNDINFSDFLILTNVVKHIAYLISTSSKPENDRIAKILFEKSKDDNCKTYKGLKKLKNNNERFENALKSYITTNFGRFSNDDINSVSQKLKSLLA